MEQNYRLSFTAGSLLAVETLKVAQLYNTLGDWDKVLTAELDEKILQKNKLASSKRQFREIRFRLQTLTDECLDYLPRATPNDQNAIILLANLKTYAFIYEFIIEVLRPKLLVYDDILRDSDYFSFFESKANLHPELTELSDSTKGKIRQVLYRILAESGLLDSVKAKNIRRPTLSPKVVELIRQDDPKWLKALLA